MANLMATRHALQREDDAAKFCFEQGRSDGVAVVPPTEARLLAMRDASGLADQRIGFISEHRDFRHGRESCH